ncbi:MAG: hypothetical protein FWG94_10350 [Oscillospiraceae bacterium]|nr:hypothetical protein [Oscillospiraceae bacterium]
MLKIILYSLIAVTTALRLTNIVFLLVKEDTNVPLPVFAVTTVMIIYGIFLITKKFINKVTLRNLMHFYIVQTFMIAFNLFYVASFSPLRIHASEILVVGTFIDILMNGTIIYFCTRRLRSRYFAVVEPVRNV